MSISAISLLAVTKEVALTRARLRRIVLTSIFDCLTVYFPCGVFQMPTIR